jgi:hypothetical protein
LRRKPVNLLNVDTMARVVTIEQACRREGVSQAALLDDLRRAIS